MAIWKQLNRERSLEQITAALQQEFSQSSDTVLEDVRQFVENLAESGFVGYELPEA